MEKVMLSATICEPHSDGQTGYGHSFRQVCETMLDTEAKGHLKAACELFQLNLFRARYGSHVDS